MVFREDGSWAVPTILPSLARPPIVVTHDKSTLNAQRQGLYLLTKGGAILQDQKAKGRELRCPFLRLFGF